MQYTAMYENAPIELVLKIWPDKTIEIHEATIGGVNVLDMIVESYVDVGGRTIEDWILEHYCHDILADYNGMEIDRAYDEYRERQAEDA